MARVSIFLIIVALIGGTMGCAPAPTSQYDLTISSTEGGSVTAPGEGTFRYVEGEVVELVAEAEEGYRFVSWTGDVDTTEDVEDATTTIITDAAKNVTANFAPLRCTLIVDSTEGGSVTTPGEGTSSYDYGTVVDLVATTDDGYQFVDWTGNVGTIVDVDATSTTITMNGDYIITADFGKEIWDWHDLNAIRENLDGSYVLMNNLDSNTAGYEELASPTANQGKGWEPIGGVSVHPELGCMIPVDPLTGGLYGQGYEIRDLFISRPNEEGVGLFGSVGLAVIKSLGVTDADVTGHRYVGSLVGYAPEHSAVSNSYSTGTISGDCVGGLMGYNVGTVSNSYFSGNVTGDQYVGGLLGENTGTVSNCYSTGSVTGDGYVGGLVGMNFESRGTVRNSFWDTETSGQATSPSGTGKTTAEMKDITTFSGAGWNITTVANPNIRNPSYIWNIVDGQTYPFLSWEAVS
jgi:hypothetical protein